MMMCSFCGKQIPDGTGKMYVKKDGSIYHFCKNKCEKSMFKLKRDPKRVKWTKAYRDNK
ncbi:MAG: 50S ribosomal protein L24e [Candidatus Woesearchaeota archaeon]